MVDLRTFKGCYSIKRQLLWLKFCKALVTRYVLSYCQISIYLNCLFQFSVHYGPDSLLLQCDDIRNRSILVKSHARLTRKVIGSYSQGFTVFKDSPVSFSFSSLN